MRVPIEDVERTEGRVFSVARKEGRGQRWQTVARGLTDLIEAVRLAADLEGACETCVFTDEGFMYWNSRFPEVYNSSVTRL